MAYRAFPFSSARSLALVAALLATGAAGCAQKIGDSCVLSTDCSTQGDRQCDTSMPGGYCTIFNCSPNSCPDYAACYLFHPEVPGCQYNDRTTSRSSESFCMEGCATDGDCRGGYVCRDGRLPPWNALLLDDNQAQKVCLPSPDTAFGQTYATPDGGPLDGGPLPVCQAYPDIDAAFPPLPDAGAVVSVDAGDAGSDAGAPADAGSDATLDAGGAHDSGPDATLQDSGSVDAASD